MKKALLMIGLSCMVSANLHHIKVLGDSTPDLSNIQAFGQDIGSQWESNHDKAIALGYWLGKLTKYGAPMYFSRQWDDPIAFLNNNSYGMCSDMTLLLNAMGEGTFGFKGRRHELSYLSNPLHHTVPEIEYDGSLHFIDPSYGLAYCHYDNGSITSLEDAALNPYYSRFNLPSAITKDTDGDGPIKAWLSYGRKDRTTDKLMHGQYEPQRTWIEQRTEGYYGVHTFDISIKENEYYTRYWNHLDGLDGFGSRDFFWPHYNYKKSNDFTWNENDDGAHRSNGLWGYSPDLTQESSYESAHNIQTINGDVYPSNVNEEGSIVFKVDSANFVTGALLKAEVVRKTANDRVVIEASSSGGNYWFNVWDSESTGEDISINENISDRIRGTLQSQDLRHVTDYLVRVRLISVSEVEGAGLKNIELSTVTSIAKASLPHLKLGSNEILIDRANNNVYQTKRFSPVMTNHKNGQNGTIQWGDQEAWELYAADHRNIRGASNGNLYTGLWKTSGNLGWVTYVLEAPRAIKRARLGGSFIIRENSNDNFTIKYRTFNGEWSEWQNVAHYDWNSRNNSDARENQTHLEAWNIEGEGVTKVEFRTEAVGYPHIEALHMEIDYEPKVSANKPLYVTYSWTEYHENAQGDLPISANQGTTRTYKERVTNLPHRFYVNTHGDIQPQMNWVSMHLEGSDDPINNAPLGYSDANAGDSRDYIPTIKYDIGNIISIDKEITASSAPSSGEIAQLIDGRVTSPVDGQSSNEEEIVQFEQGIGTVEFIIDLQSVQPVGGVRVDSYRADRSNSLFPESVVVESMVGGNYQVLARDTYGSAKYAHNLWPASWSIPKNASSETFGSFPNYGLYSNYTFIPFENVVNTRYLKVRVEEQNFRGRTEGFALSEIHVYDRLTQNQWSPKLAHVLNDYNNIENPSATLEIEAESGNLEGDHLDVESDNSASDGHYIVGKRHYNGEASYTFTVPSDGNYFIWCRYIAPDAGKNSFFVKMDEGKEVIWDLDPLSTQWHWEKVTSRASSDVMQYHLTQGTHTLHFRVRERLSALDKLVITNDPEFNPNDLSGDNEVIYEDAENGNVEGWSIFSNASGIAAFRNVFDQDRNSRVIALEGTAGKGDGFMLGGRSGTDAWQNEEYRGIEWSMNYNADFTVYISMETSNGRRYITYSPRDNDRGLRGQYIGIGLGSDITDGTWRTFSRNLDEDLRAYEPNNTIISVNAFLIRGSGLIDDILLKEL